MKKNGKIGAQTKFPRVLKNEKYDDWKSFVAEYCNKETLQQ
jgi:hypothetical protein